MHDLKKAFFAFRVPMGRAGLPRLAARFDHLPTGTHKALNALVPAEEPALSEVERAGLG